MSDLSKWLAVLTMQGSTCRAVGAVGEKIAAHLLERSGYFIRVPDRRHAGDLHAIIPDTGQLVKIEVKTARRSKDKKWRFTLFKRGHTDARHSDVVMLLAASPAGFVTSFLVPAYFFAGQRQAVITSNPLHYAGKLAQFRQQGRLVLPDPSYPKFGHGAATTGHKRL